MITMRRYFRSSLLLFFHYFLKLAFTTRKVQTEAAIMSSEKTGPSQTTEINISPTVTSDGLDDNYKLYESLRDAEIDPAEAKRVRRKVDLRILSLLMVTYVLQYLDKNSINLSSVYGLQKSLHLRGQQYSWLGTSSPISHF